MRVDYLGRHVIKDDFENIKQILSPCAVVTFKEDEIETVCKRLDMMPDYEYEIVENCAYINVFDKNDYKCFMQEWKESKAEMQR